MQTIGQFTPAVIDALSLSIPAGTPILLGESNVDHMRRRHPDDFEKYGGALSAILARPDYVGLHPTDGSIEFVREYSDYVKVAVRVSASGKFYARSLYVLNPGRVANFIAKGTLRRVVYP